MELKGEVIRMRLVYSPEYNISFMGLENLHPFDSKKYGRAWDVLESRFGNDLKNITVSPKRSLTEEDLAAVHSADYLKKIKDSVEIAHILEIAEVRAVPFIMINQFLLKPMRWACAGTMLAAAEAMKVGFAINMGGGYHHASPDAGGGFCVYSDIAMAINSLRQSGSLAESDVVAYIDLDAHQGDGVCHTYMHDLRVQLFDMYSEFNFPDDQVARDRLDWDIPVTSDWSSEDYLLELKNHLPEFLNTLIEESEKVGFAIYNAGTDVYEEDPLGQLNVTAEAILQRDLFVIEELRKRQIPTLMLLSGGYTRASYQLVAESISEFIRRGF